ncbi:hypothetical protein ACQPYE_17270 [Actinosynnema sp. CA-299493]
MGGLVRVVQVAHGRAVPPGSTEAVEDRRRVHVEVVRSASG